MSNVKSLFPIFLLFILSNCSPSVANDLKTPLPSIEPRPDFILETAPSESQILPLSVFESLGEGPSILEDNWNVFNSYNSQVCLKVRTALLAENGDNFIDNSIIIDRATIFVDDVEAIAIFIGDPLELINIETMDGQILKRGVQERVICGVVSLERGIHEVLFKFRQTSGDILEYQWQFELTRG